jgi:Ras-related C3 botulinum toxin substrate 1
MFTYLNDPPDAPRILVGTKTDLRDDKNYLQDQGIKEVVTTDMVIDSSSIYFKGNQLCAHMKLSAYVECSAKGNYHVEEVFFTCIREYEKGLQMEAASKKTKRKCVLL